MICRIKEKVHNPIVINIPKPFMENPFKPKILINI
jgi:hypothetical protein